MNNWWKSVSALIETVIFGDGGISSGRVGRVNLYSGVEGKMAVE